LSAGQHYYHLTAKARFKLNPKFAPADHSISIVDRSGRPGIYITQDVERWVNGYGYLRPFLVELIVDPTVKDDPGIHGRWGGELFVPASSFDKLKIKRVIPIDAYVRETYGAHGWVESAIGREFDTEEPIPEQRMFGPRVDPYPFRGWRYSGPDVRNMPSSDTKRLRQWTTKARRTRGR